MKAVPLLIVMGVATASTFGQKHAKVGDFTRSPTEHIMNRNPETAEPHIERVIQVFLNVGEAAAARWIQMPKGILLLQMIPGDPNIGSDLCVRPGRPGILSPVRRGP